MSLQPDEIAKAIDELILFDGDTRGLFKKQRQNTVANRNLYLREIIQRLTPEALKEFIDDETWHELPDDEWERTYIYGSEDEPTPEELLYPANHALMFEDMRDAAMDNWLKRKQKDCSEILMTAANEIGVAVSSEEELIGLIWKGDNEQLTQLCEKLKKRELISPLTDSDLFQRVFSCQSQLTESPIGWLHDKKSLGYFFYLLVVNQLIDTSDYSKAISKGDLFRYNRNKPVTRIRNEVSKFASGETEPSGTVYEVISKVIGEIS